MVIAFVDKSTTALDCWHEAVAFAANKSLPIIFVVEDNSATEPASFKASDEEDGPIQIARGQGLPIIPVDANDVVAVYRVACESVERVRQGGCPVLVEGKPYRLYSQTKRRLANIAARRNERDPLTHMERYLKAKGLFTPSWKKQVVQEFSRKLDSALKDAKKNSGKATEKARKPPPSHVRL